MATSSATSQTADVNIQSKEIRRVSAPAPSAATAHIDKLYAPQKAKQAQIFQGDPKEAAAKLVEKLKFEARVL